MWYWIGYAVTFVVIYVSLIVNLRRWAHEGVSKDKIEAAFLTYALITILYSFLSWVGLVIAISLAIIDGGRKTE